MSLKELKIKRSSYKSKFTQFKNYLNVLITCNKPSSVQLAELNARLAKIDECYTEYDSLQLEIESLTEISDSEREVQYSDREKFESEYFSTVAKARDWLTGHTSAEPQLDQSSSKSSVEGTVLSGRPQLKLPTILLPTFSGQSDKWLEFHDTFISLIHGNDNIPKINKFHYLRSSLKDKAANVINSLDFSSNNYDVAWDLLCDRYHNNKLLITNHIQAIFNIDTIHRESSLSLRNMIDTVNKNLRSLNTLKIDTQNWDLLLIHIATNKLDPITDRKWKEEINKTKDLPTLKDFLDFIKGRAELLETINNPNHHEIKRRHSEPVSARPRSFVANFRPSVNATSTFSCPLCKGDHAIHVCPSFRSLSTQGKLDKVNKLKLCVNCLRRGHDVRTCWMGSCRICSKKHNTSLHRSEHTSSNPAPDTSVSGSDKKCVVLAAQENKVTETPTSHHETVLSSTHHSCVLLSTALVNVVDYKGDTHTVRAMLDNGSTASFITENLSKTLKLPIHSTSINVEGLNRGATPITSRSKVVIHSRTDLEYSLKIDCFIIKQIAHMIPSEHFDTNPLNIPANIKLADPTFNSPSEIDMLLSADVFWSILSNEQISLGKDKPILNNTKLGWLVSGSLTFNRHNSIHKSFHCSIVETDIQNQLNRFFELESVPSVPQISKEEHECEQHFKNTTTRQEDGRFVVQIPLTKSPEVLGNSYDQAVTRFHSLERKFIRDPKFKIQYCAFMQEYIDLGHMSLNENINADPHSYYLPHHGVIRESSLTTKLRVVFDASAKTTSGISFNNIQQVGPVVQDDLINILIRFRQHKYVVTSDCEKMYRCCLVKEDQRCLQQILWRLDPSQKLNSYKLNTITYGTAAAPYLATRCLVQLGKECNEPLVNETIIHDFFVDDLITGNDSEATLLETCHGVIDQLKTGHFHLRKWRSNSSSILEAIKEDVNKDKLLKLINDDHAKTLGIRWSCEQDTLNFAVNPVCPKSKLTKRLILSVIGQVFDPLGLVNPCILNGKLILQKLWAETKDWDEALPSEIQKGWSVFLDSIVHLGNVTIPRRVLCDSPVEVEIHAFSDASQLAYSACIYLRSISASGQATVHLIIAKSRVSPLKGMTTPRLELCGALLAVRLAVKIKNALRITINKCQFWCDSTIVLGWIRTKKSNLKTFVFNRIHEITENSDPQHWRYIPTDMNPADIGSRGCNAIQLQNSNLWWSGPQFLTQHQTQWPTQPNYTHNIDLPETKIVCNLTTESNDFTTRFSHLGKLQRVTAYSLRFAHNSKNPHNKYTSYLKVAELNAATFALCRIIQEEKFPSELSTLLDKKEIHHKSSLISLNPFLSSENLIRVGGRLSNSNYSYDTKHPILLHSSHHITKLIFQHYHRILMHAGPQLLLATLRHKFWTIGGRSLARKITRECVTCCRFAGRSIQPIMANLPKERVESDYPFSNTAVDYAGPIVLADRKGRGCKLIKSYICVFVCLAVRAVHIELVTEMTTQAYLAALSRFIARRGRPTTIYSDNGTNFVGAYSELSKFLKSNCNDIGACAAEQSIKFRFAPAYSPHFNGLAESSVKSIKHHLHRVLSLAHLTYEEMNTTLVLIEGILNSRPITALSSDPNDLIPLTPAHFLLGRTINHLPSPQDHLTDENRINLLQRYQRARALSTHFWQRFYKEYISELQQRHKWRTDGGQLHLGDLVLVKDDRLQPNRWLMGRITNLHPGLDGKSRVADLITTGGVIRRAYNRLCPLPLENQDKS